MKKLFAVSAFVAILATSASAQAVTATAHVVITGGAKAGTFDTQTSREGACSMNAVSKGAFGTQISDSKGAADKFNGIQLNVPGPSATGSTQFELHVNFGSIMNRSADFAIVTLPNTKKPTGKGTVSVKGFDGTTPTAAFDVTTADGVHLVGSVSCKSILRM